MSGWLPRARERSRATWATSRLWVSRLRTKSSAWGPCTWVLAASRRDAAACTTRARSRSYGVRSGASTRFGGSATSRSASWSSYSSVLSIERDSRSTRRSSRRSVHAHVHVVVMVGGRRPARRHHPPAFGRALRRPDVLAPDDVVEVQLRGVRLQEGRDGVAQVDVAG